MKRSPIRQVSAKRAATFAARRSLVEAKAIGRACEARWDAECAGVAVTLHEPLLRSQGSDPTSDAATLPVCSHCHGQIHHHVAEAYRRGLLVHSWEKP